MSEREGCDAMSDLASQAWVQMSWSEQRHCRDRDESKEYLELGGDASELVRRL
jgi:hypothetical protein